MRIEPYDAAHLDALIGLTLRAWEPVFVSIEQVLDTDVYQAFYPQQWQVSQQKAVVAENWSGIDCVCGGLEAGGGDGDRDGGDRG
jgi:hypothetical protein